MKLVLYVLITITFMMSFTPAQVEPDHYKSVLKAFVQNYNNDQFESIFSMFAPDMQKALPLEKTKAFFAGLHAQAGKIQECKFIDIDQGGTASYETKFDKGVFLLNVTLSEDSKINGFYIKPYQAKPAISNTRNFTKLSLPFKEEWTVIWGGETKELNYHVEHLAQKNAFDMVITDQDGKSFRNDGEKNEDYYAFGKELIAPCAGKVVMVVDGIKDNTPGELNPIYIPGNTVVIKSGENEFLFFAHFKQVPAGTGPHEHAALAVDVLLPAIARRRQLGRAVQVPCPRRQSQRHPQQCRPEGAHHLVPNIRSPASPRPGTM